MAEGNIIDQFRNNDDDDPIKVPAFRFVSPPKSPVEQVIEGAGGGIPQDVPNVSSTGREIGENERVAEGATVEPSSLMENVPSDASDLQFPEPQAPVGQTTTQLNNQYINQENQQLQLTPQLQNVNDSVTYGQFYPTLFQGPSANELRPSIGSGYQGLLDGPQSSQPFDPSQLSPLPQTRTDPYVFRPDSTKNAFGRFTDWLKGTLAPTEFKPLEGKFGQSGQGVLGGIIYGLGLPFNFAVGLANDASNVRNKVVAQLPKPVQNVLDFNPLSTIDNWMNKGNPNHKPLSLFHDPNPNDSDAINALRGNQQSFSAYKDEPGAIIGIRDREPGLKWWQDPGFVAGLAIDVIADPGDIIFDKLLGGVSKTAKKLPREPLKARELQTAEGVVEKTQLHAKPIDLTNNGVVHYGEAPQQVPLLGPGKPAPVKPKFKAPDGMKLVRNTNGVLEWKPINAPRPVKAPPTNALVPASPQGFTSDIPTPEAVNLPDDVGVIHYADPAPEFPLLPEVAGSSQFKTGNELIPSPVDAGDTTIGNLGTEPLIHYADPIPERPLLPEKAASLQPRQIEAPPEVPLLPEVLEDVDPRPSGGISYPEPEKIYLLPPGQQPTKPIHQRIQQRTVKVPVGAKFRVIENTTSQAAMPVLESAVPLEVFEPLPSVSEVAEALTQPVAGMQVSPAAVRKQERKLSQINELAKLTPGPDGKPILAPDAKPFRTWKQVEQRLAGLGDDYARIFDRYGPAIPEEALRAPEGLNIQTPTGEVMEVKKEVRKGRGKEPPLTVYKDPSVIDPKFADPLSVQHADKTWKQRQWDAAKKAARDYELTGDNQALVAFDEAANNLAHPNVAEDPDALRSLQRTDLPRDLHADAPETQAFIDAKVDFENASHAVTKLSMEYKDTLAKGEELLKQIDTTPDIGRQTDLNAKPPGKAITPEAKKTVEAAKAIGLLDVEDPIDAMHKMSMVADWNTELAIREGVQAADYDPVKYMGQAVEMVNRGEDLSSQLTLPRVLEDDIYPTVTMEQVDAKARELGYVRPADMKDHEWKSTVMDGILSMGKPQEVRKYYRKTSDVPRLTAEEIRAMAPINSVEDSYKAIQDMMMEGVEDVPRTPGVPKGVDYTKVEVPEPTKQKKPRKSKKTAEPTPDEAYSQVKDMFGNSDERTLKAVDQLNKTDNIFDAIKERRESIRENLTPKLTGTFYHGTKVQGLDLRMTDPLMGGKRAELGPAHYLTQDYTEAVKYSQADLTRDVPMVPGRKVGDAGEVIKVDLAATHKQIIDGNDSPSDAVMDIVNSVVDDVLDTSDPIDNAVRRKFQQGLKRLEKEGRLQMRDVYDQFDKAMANVYKVAPPVSMLDNFQRNLNRELAANGFKGVMYRGDDDIVRLAIFDGQGILDQAGLGKTAPAADQLDLAVQRFNVDSKVAEANPRSIKAQTDLRESAAALQHTLGATTKAMLDDAVEGQVEAARRMLVEEDNLRQAAKAKEAKTTQKAKRARKAQAEDIERHLGKSNDNPCSF